MKYVGQLLQLTRRHRSITFVLGVILVWLIEEVLAQLRDTTGLINLMLALVVVLAAAGIFILVARAISERREPPRRFLGPQPTRHRGLIFMYSKSETFIKAVELHKPTLEYIWLVVTPQVRGQVEALRQEYAPVEIFTADVAGPWQSAEVAGAVESAARHAEKLGLTTSDLICDVTSGTSAMTTGAVAACLRLEIELQMVPGQYDAVLNVQRPLEVIKLEV